jgi:DnaK suppressor protein
MPKKIRQENLRKTLRERKRKLLAGLHKEIFNTLGSDYRGAFDRAMDVGDVSLIDLMQSIDVKLISIQQEDLIKMDTAERKLNEGTYGICEECGIDISEARLAALPYAIRCIECEEKLEGTDIKGHGPTL